MKKVLGFAVIAVAIVMSAFTSKPLITAGWYAADNNELSVGPASYTFVSTNFQEGDALAINPLVSGQPAAGSQVGQCQTDPDHACAINFDVNGNSTGTPYVVSGDYRFE